MPAPILGGLIPQARFTTIIILVINFGLYLAEALNPQSRLTDYGASVPWSAMNGQWWRLVTAGFLHGSIWHILMNSWVLFTVGAEIETVYDTSRFIVLYFVSTVTGFLASSIIGHHFSVGSSAGIFGLIGAMLAYGVLDRSSQASMVRSLYGRWVIYSLVLSFWPGVDLFAHIGGLAGGFLMGAAVSTPRARLMWKEPLIRGAAVVCVLLTALSFAMMFLMFTRSRPLL